MDGRGYLATGKPRSPGSASKVGAHCVSLPTPTIKGHPRGIRFACAHGEQQKSAPVSLNVILRFYFSKRPAVEGKLRPSLRYTLRLSARSAVLVANNSIHLVVKRPCRGSALRTRRKWATSHGPSPATACLQTEKPQTNATNACVCATLLIIRRSTQTDLPRFFLPFAHHLRKMTEALISACAPADGGLRSRVALTLRSACAGAAPRCHGHPGHARARAGCPWHVAMPTSRSALPRLTGR